MSTEFDRAVREWGREVDEVATDLVKRGVPPYEAIDQAREIVSHRRRRKAANSPVSSLPARP